MVRSGQDNWTSNVRQTLAFATAALGLLHCFDIAEVQLENTFSMIKTFRQRKKFLVWLCWKGCRPPSTHWRGPTTDPHGDSWLLALAPGPVRPSSSNLNPSDSSVGPMLMRALVRTPDQHDPMTNRVPSLKPSLKLASW